MCTHSLALFLTHSLTRTHSHASVAVPVVHRRWCCTRGCISSIRTHRRTHTLTLSHTHSLALFLTRSLTRSLAHRRQWLPQLCIFAGVAPVGVLIAFLITHLGFAA